MLYLNHHLKLYWSWKRKLYTKLKQELTNLSDSLTSLKVTFPLVWFLNTPNSLWSLKNWQPFYKMKQNIKCLLHFNPNLLMLLSPKRYHTRSTEWLNTQDDEMQQSCSYLYGTFRQWWYLKTKHQKLSFWAIFLKENVLTLVHIRIEWALQLSIYDLHKTRF